MTSSLQENDVVGGDQFVYTAQFDEALLAAELGAEDVELTGAHSGIRLPGSFSYDPGTSTLQLSYDDLPDDNYSLRLISGDGAFEDLAGNDLDGEPVGFPLPPNLSGDGMPGGDFSVNFDTDLIVSPLPTPLEPQAPLGSWVYEAALSGHISSGVDTDSYTVELDDGQTIAVLAESNGTLAPRVEILAPSTNSLGDAVAPAPGSDAFLQAVQTAGAGNYTVVVSGDAGSTGGYALRFVLNALLESEFPRWV